MKTGGNTITLLGVGCAIGMLLVISTQKIPTLYKDIMAELADIRASVVEIERRARSCQ